MPTKQQLDKEAWEWTETTQPQDVTTDHVDSAYRVTLPVCTHETCRRNCKGNPNCLVGLGEKEWLGDISDDKWHEVDDPNLERRTKGMFVGLKNLGATCYVNTFLQVWFHNKSFRAAVYLWRPLDKPYGRLMPVIKGQRGPRKSFGAHKSLQQSPPASSSSSSEESSKKSSSSSEDTDEASPERKRMRRQPPPKNTPSNTTSALSSTKSGTPGTSNKKDCPRRQPSKYSLANAINDVTNSGTPVSEKELADLEFRLKRAEVMRNMRAKKKKDAGRWTPVDEERLQKSKDEMNDMLKVLAKSIASKSPSPPKPQKKLKKVKKDKSRKRLIGAKEKRHKKGSDEVKCLAYNAYMANYMKDYKKRNTEERLSAEEEASTQMLEENGHEEVKVKEEVDTSVIEEKPFKMVVEVQNNLLMAAPEDEENESPPASQNTNSIPIESQTVTETIKKKLTKDDYRIRHNAYARRQRANLKKAKGLWTDEDEYRRQVREYGVLPGAVKPDPSLLLKKNTDPQSIGKKSDPQSLDKKPDMSLLDQTPCSPKVKKKMVKPKVLKEDAQKALEKKRARKAIYERLRRVEMKKHAGKWTDMDEAKFVAREGKSSEEVIKSFREEIDSKMGAKSTEKAAVAFSKTERDRRLKRHMLDFVEQVLSVQYGERKLNPAERRDRHNSYQRERASYIRVLEREERDYARQRLARQTECRQVGKAKAKNADGSWTEKDKEREKERGKKQMLYQQKRKVLLKACRKISPKHAKVGRGGRKKFPGRRLTGNKPESAIHANGVKGSSDDISPLTNGASDGAAPDATTSLHGTVRGGGRGRGRGQGRGRGRGLFSTSANHGLPNGIEEGQDDKLITVTLNQIESSRVVARGRGRGVRGRSRGRGRPAKNFASGDAMHAGLNGDMTATTGRGRGTWRKRGRGQSAGGDNIISSWRSNGNKRDFLCTEISPEIQLDYKTYHIGRKQQYQGTCYLIAGYEYIRNRSCNNRTFLRCRNRKTCFAKATILHKTNKAVVTCSDHTHPPPKDIPKDASEPVPQNVIEANPSATSPNQIAATNSVHIKQEVVDETYYVDIHFPSMAVTTHCVTERREAKASSVDGSGSIGSTALEKAENGAPKCVNEEPMDTQEDRCRGIVREELKVLSDEALTPTSICGHLQLIFALLEHSNRRYIDPSGLINCLGLDSALQQDAQEFSKLFISLLEDTLQQQPNPIVRNIIKEQFCGKYAYVTRCNNCTQSSERVSEFYELDLNIKGHKALGESLQEFLQEEKLEGANRYSCDNCKSKQDATRRIQLLDLPPVLNVQLLRFVFDRQSGTKKKLNTFIQFPSTLDLSPYMPGRNHDAVYDLTAVLIHRGPTAYSGHYIAHIREDVSGSWYKFNDEDVEKMEGKNLKLGYEDDLQESGGKGGKRPRVPKGYHASKNAYMLVYHKRTHAAQQPIASSGPLVDYLEEMIFRDNLHFESWIQEMASMREDNVKSGKERHIEIKELYQQLTPVPSDKYEWITADWLRDWLNDENTECKPINNSSMVCRHDNVDPDKINDAKRISAKAAQLLYSKYGGGPRLTEKHQCYKCVREKCNMMRLKTDLNADHKFITANTKVKLEPQGESPTYWIGKASLRNWRRLAIQRGEVTKKEDGQPAMQNCQSSDTEGSSPSQNDEQLRAFNEDIMCQHGNLSPDESGRRLVSTEVWNRLRKYFPECPEFSQETEVCDECQMANMEEDQMNSLLQNIATDYKTSLPQLFADRQRPTTEKKDVREIYVINRTFVDEWRDFVKQPLRHTPPSAINNNILTCSHNKFMFEPGQLDEFSSQMLVYIWPHEWESLVKHFGSDTVVKLKRLTQDTKSAAFISDPEPCAECISARYSQEEKNRFEYSGARIYIRKVTADLLGGHSSQDEDKGTCSEGSIKEEDPDFSGQQNGIKKPKLSMSPVKPSGRRSSRHRKVRGEKEVVVSSTNTLKELKVKVMHAFSVAPFDQTLLLNGRVLTGESNDSTLANLGVEPECIITLKVDAPQMEDPLVMDEIYRASTVPEAGFKGTGLLNH